MNFLRVGFSDFSILKSLILKAEHVILLNNLRQILVVLSDDLVLLVNDEVDLMGLN